MKRHVLAFLPVLAVLLFGCTATPPKKTDVAPAKAPAPEVNRSSPTTPSVTTEPSTPADVEKLNQSPAATPAEEKPTPDTYALHHRVFPNLLFKTDGKFFASLHEGDFNRLREIIAESYGQHYANAMHMKSVSLPDIVFITFAEPTRAPLCYHVALVKKGETFLYFTLEKSEDILATGVKSAFCGWSEDMHLNYGPRKYTSLDEFEEEVRSFLAKQQNPEPAATTTTR